MGWSRAGVIFFVCVVAAACGTAVNKGRGFGESPGASGGAQADGPVFGESDGGQPACAGLQCQQVACPGGGHTTVSGTVFAPNGTLPLYNAIVYVPNAPVEPFTSGVSCDVCGSVASGSPVTAALSNPDGTFSLDNVPVGSDIPLVIQLGRWRRQVTIPQVDGCTDTHLDDPNLTRLPRNQREGDLPHIAHTTGGCDKLGCMLPKIGIDASEFGVAADGPSKAIHSFVGAQGGVPKGAGPAQPFWSDVEKMKQYDMLILSCECSEHLEDKGPAAYQAVADYLKSGGRIFTTDFMYDWYKFTSDPGLKSVSNIPGGAPPAGNTMRLDTSFPKGQALADWLKVIFPASTPVQNGQVPFDIVFGNLKSVNTGAGQVWAHAVDGPTPRIFTVNMPVGVPAEQQCGKGVYIDAHVNQAPPDVVGPDYPNGCPTPLKEGEAALAFFFFDLAACIQNDGQAPPPPVTH